MTESMWYNGIVVQKKFTTERTPGSVVVAVPAMCFNRVEQAI
jgi:hypothetical protein